MSKTQIQYQSTSMQCLRQVVGGPKNRFIQDGYNLDLTYITPRIIAMAFPATGFESLYRNHASTVARLLQQRHQNRHLIINVSGRQVDQSILSNVSSFDWEDHKAPTLQTLFTICSEVAQLMHQNTDRVVLFHCNHGKGRTGTIICCFLLYMGMFTDWKQVMNFYAQKRFTEPGQGVTQPCQIQYVRYFDEVLKTGVKKPQILKVERISLLGGYDITSPKFRLVTRQGEELYDTDLQSSAIDQHQGSENSIRFVDKHSFTGDMTLEVWQKGLCSCKLLISYLFNTAFIDDSSPIRISLRQLSPKCKQRQSNFEPTFMIEVEMRALSEKDMDGLSYMEQMKSQEMSWKLISDSIKVMNQFRSEGHVICYGKDKK